MITIVDSPGDPSANSYVSLAFSDEFMTASVGRGDWLAADEEVRKAALIEATRTLDSIFTWYSYPESDSQALDFPLAYQHDKFGRDIPSDTIPKDVKQVTCELAYSIFKYGSTAQTASKVDMVKVGPITLDLDAASSERFFEGVNLSSLSIFGEYQIKRSGSAYNVRVQR